MIDRKELLFIGTVGRAHGYDGSVRINLNESIVFKKKLSIKEPLFFETEGYLVPFFFDKLSISDSHFIIHPEGWKDEKDTYEYAGLAVYLNRKFAADEAEERNELLGYTIAAEDGVVVGEISAIDLQGSHALLTVEKDGKEYLIPFAEPLIVSVDHEDKRIVLSLPEGILDL